MVSLAFFEAEIITAPFGEGREEETGEDGETHNLRVRKILLIS